MSMAAKLSDLADQTSGANLQADGQMEVPTQGAKDLWGSEEADTSPSHSLSWSPAPEATVRPPQCDILFGNTSDFNRRNGGHTPTLSFLDGPTGRGHVAKS